MLLAIDVGNTNITIGVFRARPRGPLNEDGPADADEWRPYPQPFELASWDGEVAGRDRSVVPPSIPCSSRWRAATSGPSRCSWVLG
jgi:pantothenate kinase type III